jgi:hypothetical protein
MSRSPARPFIVAILGVAGACAGACADAVDGGPSRLVAPSAGARPIGCPGYVDPAHCPPFPTGGPGVVRGMVVELTAEGRRPLAGIVMWPWVGKADGSGYSHHSVVSDSSGRFLVDELPGGTVQLFAGGEVFDQPCVANFAAGDATRRDTIELVPRSRPDPSLATGAPVVSGVVYEATSAGRRPVAGARVYLETAMDLVAAVTTTDEYGRYALCRLPTATYPQSLMVTGDGRTWTYATVTVSGDTTTLDIALGR